MKKKKMPHARYSAEFREEAVRVVTEDGLSAGEASARLSLPKSTLENWVRTAKRSIAGAIGKSHRSLTELEVELANVKRELSIAKMERDILKKVARYFSKEGHEEDPTCRQRHTFRDMPQQRDLGFVQN
ncbi:MAG TPA: transposase [Desulfomonilaceae bacterium]|nr:transposase [Desulfomonilaceae bacterium]